MTASPVGYRVDDGLLHLSLARPDRGNAIDLDLARTLMVAATAASEDATVRAVLLTGEGSNFCVGGDLRAAPKAAGAEADTMGGGGPPASMGAYVREVATHLHVAVARLARMGPPVVVAVQGWAAGAGMSLASAADLLVVGESARFKLAYTAVGLSPDGGGSWSLPRLVGMQRTLELVLTNRVLTAPEAVEWGLASRVVADADLATAAEDLARSFTYMAPGALAASKRLVRDSHLTSLETQLELEVAALARNATDPSGREGIRAFLRKNGPA